MGATILHKAIILTKAGRAGINQKVNRPLSNVWEVS